MLPLLAIYLIVCAELFMRALAPTKITPRFVSASDYGVRMNTPNERYVHTSPEYQVSFAINARGLRADAETPYEKPEGVFRVVGLGDSFTFGYGAQSSETFLSVLEREASSNFGCPVEVINMGVSGFSTAESWIAFDNEGIKYDPDAVVIQWHSTDLGENLVADLFELENGELVRTGKNYLPTVEVREKLFANPVYRFIASHSMLYSWVRERGATIFKRWQVRVEAANLIAGDDRSVAKPAPSDKPPVSQEALSVAVLSGFVRSLQERGIQVLILEVPTQRRRRPMDKYIPLSESEPLYESSIPLAAAYRELVYSPISDFEEHRGQLIYWERSAGHFTPLGNELVGKGLARMLRSPNQSACHHIEVK